MFKNLSKAKKGGYTLVEMLVYIAILTVLLVAMIQSVVLLSSSYRNIKAVRSLENSAIVAVDRIQREIRDADSIDATSTFNVNPGMLKLVSGTSTVRFYLSNQRMYVEENGKYAGPLTLSDVKVTSLIFRQIATAASTAVKVEMTLQASTSATIISKNFYMTDVLRGSYQ